MEFYLIDQFFHPVSFFQMIFRCKIINELDKKESRFFIKESSDDERIVRVRLSGSRTRD